MSTSYWDGDIFSPHCFLSLVDKKKSNMIMILLPLRHGTEDKPIASKYAWKKVKVLVAQSCLPLCNPMDYSLPGSHAHGILQQEYWSQLPFPSWGDLPDPGIKPGSPACIWNFKKWFLKLYLYSNRKWQPTPVFLPGESQGQGEPGGLPSMGSHRVGHDWSDLAAAAVIALSVLAQPSCEHSQELGMQLLVDLGTITSS